MLKSHTVTLLYRQPQWQFWLYLMRLDGKRKRTLGGEVSVCDVQEPKQAVGQKHTTLYQCIFFMLNMEQSLTFTIYQLEGQCKMFED